MDSSINGMWIVPFKKFSGFRVKIRLSESDRDYRYISNTYKMEEN